VHGRSAMMGGAPNRKIRDDGWRLLISKHREFQIAIVYNV